MTAVRPGEGFAAGCWRARLFMAVQIAERCQCRQKGVPKTILAGWPGSAQLARGTAARRRRPVLPRRPFETRIAFQPAAAGHPLGREAGRFLAWLITPNGGHI